MWISKKKWNDIQKRTADLEVQVQNQQMFKTREYPSDLGTFLEETKMLLSPEAFHKIVTIIENDQNCIIDIGLKGEPGEPGQSSQEQGRNSPIISSIPDWHSSGEM